MNRIDLHPITVFTLSMQLIWGLEVLLIGLTFGFYTGNLHCGTFPTVLYHYLDPVKCFPNWM